jgi:hypothetical protein
LLNTLAIAAMHDEPVQVRARSDNLTHLIAAIPTDRMPLRCHFAIHYLAHKPHLLVEVRFGEARQPYNFPHFLKLPVNIMENANHRIVVLRQTPRKTYRQNEELPPMKRATHLVRF